MVKFNNDDYNKWLEFRESNNDLQNHEYKLLCKLHSKYYKHPIHYPCTCSTHTIKKWIKELNVIFDNGH
jgi:hypothetical protein